MNVSNDDSNGKSPAASISLYDELLEANASNKKTADSMSKIRSNVSYYKSSTARFKEELSNVSRKLSLTSQTSDLDSDQERENTNMENSHASTSNPIWQCDDFTVVSRKKKRSPEANPRNVRQKGEINSTDTATQNRFSPLLVDNSNEQDLFEQPPTKPKVQPIFVTNVTNFNGFQNELNNMGFKDKYLVKVLSNQIKLIPDDIPTYKNMIACFKSKNVNYFTHRLKQERSFRVVLRNVHHSTPHEDIKQDLAELGYVVENVSNIKHAQSKEPLSMFFVDLKNDPNNKSVYQITKMGNKIVKFEPPNKKRELPQCKRCQRFDHTQNNCGRSFRCVKCTGNHQTSSCPKTTRDTPATCVNCGESHSANYKGCQVYRKLLEKKFPALRRRQESDPKPTSRAQTPNYIRENFSFAHAAQNKQNVQDTDACLNSNQAEDQNLIAFMKQSFMELKDMFRDLMKQNSVMVNLLTTLVTKMN